MAKTEGDPVLESDQEEIALSDSELDNVLKSADITSETADGEEDSLEQYGVWVKVEPRDVGEESEQVMGFELSDLEGSSESALTEEEEQLLGELEEDEDSDLGDLSGLEDDLEELGKGNAFEEESSDEELSVEDLDVALDELSDNALTIPTEVEDIEGLPEMEGGDEFDLTPETDTEIEVALSESAIVEEHYEDLATVEGVPSTPGQAPLKVSSDILEKIERDLNQIKSEIQSIKSELSGFGRGGMSAGKVDVAPAPAGADGFFEKGEDETIALTGDELDNILNTADVTEEVDRSEESVDALDMEELPEADLMAGFAEEEAVPAEAEDEIMELGSLDLEEEEAPSGEIDLDEGELSIEEFEPSEEDSIEIDIGGDAVEELSLDADIGEMGGETEELENLGLDEPLESLSLDEPGIEEAEDAEELSLEEPADELELVELDALSLEEPGLEEVEDAEELTLEEPVDELALKEAELPEAEEELDLAELDALGLEEPGLEEAESAEELSEEIGLEEPTEEDLEELDELSLEETGLEEVEGPEDLDLAEMPVAEEAESPEEEFSLDELDESAEEADLELAPDDLSVPEIPEQGQPVTAGLSEDLRTEIKSVLSYFDQLLEALPEDKIKEFAQSEYFVRYRRLFEELGLGA